MCARLGIRMRHLGNALCRRRRVDRAVLVEDSTMAVRGVLAETYVRRDEQRGEERTQLSNCQNHGTLWVVCGCATHVLFAFQGHAKEDDASEALLHQGTDEALQSVDAPSALSWQ